MRDQPDPLERRQFWPRPGRPEALGEIDFDQPCGNCGYNLRGLPPGVGCPECGSQFGWNVGEEPIPWEEDDAPAPVSFFRTAFMAIVRSHELAKNVRRPFKLDLTAAKRFRRIAIWIALPPLCAIAWVITARTAGAAVAWWSLPMNAVSIAVWLNTATLEAVGFFKDTVSAKMLPRVECIAHYASAPLLLMPLHLAVLLLTMRAASSGSAVNYLLAAAEHIVLIVATLALGVPLVAWLLFETMSVGIVQAFILAYGRWVISAATAFALLLAMPVGMAVIVLRIMR
ncbi:hypothetical protein BH09PLA1_BH09PLA1_27770 [soil metagenome]